MAGRTQRIDLSNVPGAKKNRVKWLMSSGVRTADDANNASKAFIADLEEIKKLKDTSSKKQK